MHAWSALPIVLLLAGCATPGPAPLVGDGPPPVTDDCPGHWHAMLHVLIAGEPVVLGDAPAHQDPTSEPIGFHMHDADGVLHFHPPDEACIALGDALRKLDVTVINGGFILGGDHGDRSGSYPPTDAYRPELYAQGWGEGWVRVGLDDPFLERQVPDGTRVLLTYRDPESEPLGPQLDAVPPIPDVYRP